MTWAAGCRSWSWPQPFAVASLLTVAAVARRVREFGTLKALGWRSARIIAQVMGESLVLGLAGGAAGVGLGLAGAAIITRVAPTLSATLPAPAGPHFSNAGGPGGAVTSTGSSSPLASAAHTVLVPMTAPVSLAAIAAAVVLALAGGLIAGSFGSWRIARLRPAAALARVE